MKGRVVATSEGCATVCVEPNEACQHCDAGALCHGAGRRRTVIADNQIGARTGDTVLLEQPAAAALWAAFILFGMPVLLALVSLLAVRSFPPAVAMIAGIAGFGAGLVLAKVINERLARRQAFLPRIVETVKREGS